MFKKLLKFLVCFVLLLSFAVFPHKTLAQQNFYTDVAVTYKVLESGLTEVTHKITLENVFSNMYATSYALSFDNFEPTNIRVFEGDVLLPYDVRKIGTNVSLEIKFPDSLVGKGKQRVFEIVFDNSTFAQRTGEVWEISIPKLSTEAQFRNYSLTLSVPFSFGLEAYVSPKALDSSETISRRTYHFNKEAVSKTGITAGFGAFQVYTFTLNYHLENPVNKESFAEIALPPDTNLQKMYYRALNPEPVSVRVDLDGNWLAGYKLKPRERLDIQTTGSVQIFAGVRPFAKQSTENLANYLKPTQYWQSDNENIKDLASQYKDAKAIYDYVSQFLTYSYDRVSPQAKREGALAAYQNPTSSMCMEFTDLFIAIARAAGIPAREVDGYAYTENPKIQPLSLVADVLHAWPEYYDKETGEWIQVDPTWASTTGGIDYFSKLDLRHFTFVIHGMDDSKPYTPGSYKLGANPQKDVFVNFGKLPEQKTAKLSLSYKEQKGFPFTSTKYTVYIKNNGPVALYAVKPSVLFDNAIENEDYIEVIPPFSEVTVNVKIPYSILGRNTPDTAALLVQGSQIELPTKKGKVITDSLIVLSFILILILVIILIRLKPRKIMVLWSKFKSLFRKKGSSNKKINESENSLPNQNQGK